MEKNKSTFKDMTATVTQNVEQARGAMENYRKFVQKSLSVSPWAETDLNKKMKHYSEKNLASASEFALKLTQAKDFKDLVRIQTEFMQTQLKALSEQAKDLGETATKAATDALKGSPP